MNMYAIITFEIAERMTIVIAARMTTSGRQGLLISWVRMRASSQRSIDIDRKGMEILKLD